jgi:hypothetical protein
VKLLDRFLQTVASDEPHHLKWPAVLVTPYTMDGHDARVFQPSGDLGFRKESRSALRVVREPRLNLLERDIAV